METRLIATPLRLPSAAACVQFERESFGALHEMMRGLDEAERAEAWAEIEREFGRFEGAGGFVTAAELCVGVGRA